MENKRERTLSFVIVAIVYLAATSVAVCVHLFLQLDLWLSLLIVDVIATVVVFLFSVLLNNASVYDPYWSVQPIVIAIAMAIARPMTPYRAVMLAVVLAWGVRLTANWAYTFGGLSHQDWRYTMLAQKTGKAYPVINFVGIHLVPTLVVYACVLPVVFAFDVDSALNAGQIVFLGVSLLAVALQGTADVQMHVFRKQKRQGKIDDTFMRRGLWKHSRHPNYLGEIVMWWGVGLSFVCAVPQLWYVGVIGATLNTVLFLAVSIPLADGRQSQKEGFAQYKKETFALLPLPKPQRKNKGE